ncbi:hypothetical protein [Methylobacterium sp. Gmos1]
MLTRFGIVSVRGLWRGILTFPDVHSGTLTNLATAVLEMRVTPDDCRGWRDDYGWLRSRTGVWSHPSLTANTSGTGQGELKLTEPHAAQFYFPAEVMRSQRPGVYEISFTATVGPETAEILRDTVTFA